MSEKNNDSNKSSGEDLQSKDSGKPPVTIDDESSSVDNDQSEQARRGQQSKKDKALNENEALREDIDYLHAREAERTRDGYISDFLKENIAKYPHVKSEDLKFATSKEEVAEIAIHLENRYKDMEQSALKSVQIDSETFLTEDEINKAESELVEEVSKHGVSKFSNFINLQSRRKR